MRRKDNELYRAKAAGQNRYCISASPAAAAALHSSRLGIKQQASPRSA